MKTQLHGTRQPKGFALVISLSLMVLITVLATGLLGLSTISVRGSGRQADLATARANARMSLAMAIGRLQKYAGPDTRVTARADIQAESNPPVLGAWKSWNGENHDAQGRPRSPGNYASKKEANFMGWLASGEPGVLPETGARANSVTLVGEGSVGNGDGRDRLQIHLDPDIIAKDAGNGAMAWWISGENQKARLPKPYKPEDDSPAQWSVLAKSHAVPDPKALRMENVTSRPELADRAVSLSLGDLISGGTESSTSQEYFHDLSTVATGLLTNTATGGWKKDLSLLTENWNQIQSSNLPFFRLNKDRDVASTKPTSGNPTAARSIFYPWSNYRGDASHMVIYRQGAVSSWENLKDYAMLYRRISSSASGRNRITPQSEAIDGNAYNFLHKVRLLPLVARVQWVFSHTATQTGTNYQAQLLVSPVITMWNPYNVEITSPPNLGFFIGKPLPVALQYTVGGTRNAMPNCLTQGSLNNQPPLADVPDLKYQISSAFTLKPGETRVFSAPSGPSGRVEPAATLMLQAGYRSGGGHRFAVKNAAGAAVTGAGSATIKADARFDTSYDDAGRTGVGIYLDMTAGSNGNPAANPRHLVYRMVYTPLIANEVYRPLTQMAESTLASAASTPAPFMSTVFGARMASRTHLPAKGFVQSSPLVNYTAMGAKDEAEPTIGRDYGGTNHPVNSPFDYSFVKHAPGGDSQLPNASDTSGRGYIVTGFNKSDGLSRCVIAEVPVRPIASICELQHWDLRYDNPIPPFAFNLIGNSDASPLLPSNAVFNSGPQVGENLQHDDSYCANHLLFDDWFFSSIAPDPSNYGTSGRSQETVWADFVNGQKPLATRAYRPITADSAMAGGAAGNAGKLFSDHVSNRDGWKNIASRIEVEGMFNVNSTSVTAWRALLGHARGMRVPHIVESGAGWSVDASEDTDHAVSRFSIAGDTEAGSSGSSGSFPEATEFSGYRVLDDGMIDQLAENIVAQVRARGPFLSLSEFVNRQLSTGELALAGAVQTALNQLASGPDNPFQAIEAAVGTTGRATSTPPRSAEAGYRHPAAAAGWNAYGLPGWTRQADILRPLAPVLSARDDSFIIRAYGDARDDSGNILCRAVCEAVVRRVRDYVDPSEAADLATPSTSPVNMIFGRRFEMIGFRWLTPSEI